MFEFLETAPALEVREREFQRLLGYPPRHLPGDAAAKLGVSARRQFSEAARPWVYVREAPLQLGEAGAVIGGRAFASARLRRHLGDSGAGRVLLLAASAGAGVDARSAQLWEEGRGEEQYFLGAYASAFVEALLERANARLCGWAERSGWFLLPHDSPGYDGWDLRDQRALFDLIVRGAGRPLPLEVLESGMLRPTKSLLAVIGLAPRGARRAAPPHRSPCRSCSLTPCAYRRVPYTVGRRPAGIPTQPNPRVPSIPENT